MSEDPLKVEQPKSPERKDLAEFLDVRNPEILQVLDANGELITLYSFEHSQKLPADLPVGYAFMGGEARNLVIRELGEDVKAARDMDIVAIEEFEPDLSSIDSLSEEYMYEDYQYGHGIGTDNLDNYFASRDFTINEVLVHGNRMIVSEKALMDLSDKVIRPTVYETETWDLWNGYQEEVWGVQPKLAMKALRIQIEFQNMYDKGDIKGIEDWQWEFDNIPLFWLAYGLNRAYQSGDDVAESFFVKLLEKGTLPDPDVYSSNIQKKLRETALNIRFDMNDSFDFDNPDWNGRPLEEILDDYEDRYEDIAEEHKHLIRYRGKKRKSLI